MDKRIAVEFAGTVESSQLTYDKKAATVLARGQSIGGEYSATLTMPVEIAKKFPLGAGVTVAIDVG